MVMIYPDDDGFGDIKDPGCLTDEERTAICTLMDETELTEGESGFVNDLAEFDEGDPVTDPQREWLTQIIEKYGA